ADPVDEKTDWLDAARFGFGTLKYVSRNQTETAKMNLDINAFEDETASIFSAAYDKTSNTTFAELALTSWRIAGRGYFDEAKALRETEPDEARKLFVAMDGVAKKAVGLPFKARVTAAEATTEWLTFAEYLMLSTWYQFGVLKSEDAQKGNAHIDDIEKRIMPPKMLAGDGDQKLDYLRANLVYTRFKVNDSIWSDEQKWQALAQALSLARSEAMSANSTWQEQAKGLLDELRTDVNDLTDARWNAIRSASDKQPERSAVALEKIVDDRLRLKPVISNNDPWFDLWLFERLAEAASYQERAGEPDAAERLRLRARDLYLPYADGKAISELSAKLADEVRETWKSVYDDHHQKRIDVLYASATAAVDFAKARTLFHQVIDEDADWDSKFGLNEWDRVFRAGVWIKLADRQKLVGDMQAADSEHEACKLLDPLAGTFSLQGQQKIFAQELWQKLNACKAG
ncbi:MAG: hypothetical protein KGO94_10655, partial [Alphaproteobacteria bacterium]|nr:hypothetical protein [Alphaproteobacteria bacterium]